MNSHKQLATVAFLAALACTGLRAQTATLRATVPFDFNAGNKLMPAGEYTVHEEGLVIFLHGSDKGSNVILMTNGSVDRAPSLGARLDFKRYGSNYFLRTIWDPFTQSGHQVHQTSREKELAKGGEVPVETAVTLASTK